MWTALLLFLGRHQFLHATATTVHTRQFVQRWKPSFPPLTYSPQSQPPKQVSPYSDAMRLLESRICYGVLSCKDEDITLCLLTHEVDKSVLRVVLWSADMSMAEKTSCLRSLRTWHRRTLSRDVILDKNMELS